MTETKKIHTDLEIAQQCKMRSISQIASELGLDDEEFEQYGKFKAKLSLSVLENRKNVQHAPVVLVTAISPTSAGEGKSTVSVGLAQAFAQLGEQPVLALREPSLGPTLGLKGGACGGGWSQVVPMEDINLHFTGDLHALTCAHNALSAYIDNHIHQGNELQLDVRRILWNRALDLNDRALRHVTIGLGGPIHGMPREERFEITVASELMAILCLATSLTDLKQRIGNIVVGYNYAGEPVTVRALGIQGGLTMLLKDAIQPNLVQTLEGTPAIIHGGPFANIAHGCNSVLATQMARTLGSIVVTEAGFGADLGAEKYMHIKAAAGNCPPDAVVIVATLRALKMHGGVDKNELHLPNEKALEMGLRHLEKHIQNMKLFNVPYVVAVNVFHTDTENELQFIQKWAERSQHTLSLANVWAEGGKGGVALAENVLSAIQKNESTFTPLYDASDTIQHKIQTVCTKIYGASAVTYSAAAQKKLAQIIGQEAENWPICIAKTPFSFSCDPTLFGTPSGFSIPIQDIKVNYGAKFVVCYAGNILAMPGLPKVPALEKMDIDENGKIVGLF
ncbi:MAG: formate--tetrahydrofolate ligase [Bacilli bacterium]